MVFSAIGAAMNTISPTTRHWIILTCVLVVVFTRGCSRYTKQYNCQSAAKAILELHMNLWNGEVDTFERMNSTVLWVRVPEAIRLDSTLATAYACRGGVLANTGELSKALKDFNQALKIQPENGDFYYSRSQVYERLEDTDLALADLAKAVELITSELGRSMAFSQRAGIYQKQGSSMNRSKTTQMRFD
jgi:tetratricopeptide (TPR) repeat protein